MGHSLVFMPECHSTNDEASQLIQANRAPEGTLVITNNQTAGRGQRSNVWLAESGKNFTFSIVLKPSFLLIKDQFLLNIAVSLGIADYLFEVLKEPVKIKWPNDIIVRDKKICGILIENQISGQLMRNCIVGIGLNVNQESFAFDKATSMKRLVGTEFSLEQELPNLLHKIELRYLMLREGDVISLFGDYLATMYWRNERRLFSTFQKEFEGTITGVDEIGRLMIEMEDEVKVFSVKEVEFLR